MHSMNGVLDAEPDPQAAFNLVLCTFALGDKEMMKQAFSKLVEVVLKSFCMQHKRFATYLPCTAQSCCANLGTVIHIKCYVPMSPVCSFTNTAHKDCIWIPSTKSK